MMKSASFMYSLNMTYFHYVTRERIYHGYVHIFLRLFWHANFNFEQRVPQNNG